MEKQFALTAGFDYIELMKLLKILNIIETGGMAKEWIRGGNAKVNGEIELRPTKKLRSGDRIEIQGFTITIK